mgnify:CR=1 FL=1
MKFQEIKNNIYYCGLNDCDRRIYATAFWTKEDLADYLHFLEEAEKRDHRKIGAKLDLFSTRDELGGGLVLWHPNLAVVREEIENRGK